MGNDRDYLHPTVKKKGLFTRKVGPLIHEYHCKLLAVPIVELEFCITGVPVVIRGELHSADINTGVVSSHIKHQACNSGFPVMIKTTGQVWVKIGKRVLQAETSLPLQDRVDFTATDKLTTLYTAEELLDWESFNSFPAMQRSRHQRILNAL